MMQIETDLYSMYNNFDGMGLCEAKRHSINCVITVGEIIAAVDDVAVGRCTDFVRFWLEAILVAGAASDAAADDDAAVGAGVVDVTVVDYSIVLWWEFRCLLKTKKMDLIKFDSTLLLVIGNKWI